MMVLIIPLIHDSPYEVIPNVNAILKMRNLRIRNTWLVGVEYEIYASTLNYMLFISQRPSTSPLASPYPIYPKTSPYVSYAQIFASPVGGVPGTAIFKVINHPS